MQCGSEQHIQIIIDTETQVEQPHLQANQERMGRLLPHYLHLLCRITRQMVGVYMVGFIIVQLAQQERMRQTHLSHQQLTRTAPQRFIGMRFHREQCQ